MLLMNKLEYTKKKENSKSDRKLNEIKRFLMNQNLNEIFPFDITTDPEPTQETTQRQSSLPTELPVAPLPKTPDPAANMVATAPKINPNTGLTTTETALLSPGEQAIRLRQRT